jgi:hypothetical protein
MVFDAEGHMASMLELLAAGKMTYNGRKIRNIC